MTMHWAEPKKYVAIPTKGNIRAVLLARLIYFRVIIIVILFTVPRKFIYWYIPEFIPMGCKVIGCYLWWT